MNKVEITVQNEKLDNVKAEHVQALMSWLREQPHLPHVHITELDVILAYDSCEYDPELTKKVLDVNFTLRTLLSFYQDRKMDQRLEYALETWLITPVPTISKKGYRPIYCELLDADPNKFVYHDVIKLFLMIMDIWNHQEGAGSGVAIIVNLDRVTLAHISRVNLTTAQQFFYFLQEGMFVSLKEFIFFNAPMFVEKLLAMVRPFMKDELLRILKVHNGGFGTVKEYMTEDFFKQDKNILKAEINYNIRANTEFFEIEAQKRVDESKRPGGPKSLSSFFPGIEENFKKLEID